MKIEVSIGEIVDKATILEIKKEKFKSSEKLSNVIKEYQLLTEKLRSINLTPDHKAYKELKTINLELWEIEDQIRIKESRKEFDDNFIKLARSVYITNDKRALIKKKINLEHGSFLVEEKEYAQY